MDMVFLLDEETRCLRFTDGYYEDESAAEASSSGGGFGRRLFDAYSGTVCVIDGGVPGLAFKEGRPHLMLAEESLQFLATTEAQRQFYQGARIKVSSFKMALKIQKSNSDAGNYAAFLACTSGEIEIGTSSNQYSSVVESRSQEKLNSSIFAYTKMLFSSDLNMKKIVWGIEQVNLEMEDIRNLFTEDMVKQFGLASLHQIQERSISSSSSSLRSVSLGSPEYSSGLLPMIPSFQIPVIRNPTAIQPRPSAYMVDAAMTKAMLAVLSSTAPSSSSSSSSSPSSLLSQLSTQGTAFQRYSSESSRSILFHRTSLQSQYLLKLSVAILRAINDQRRIQSVMIENQPTASQLSHVISERKRREKLNESFQSLRALLPPGSKLSHQLALHLLAQFSGNMQKDKASILAGARETLAALKAEVSELERRNQVLQSQSTSRPTTEARRGEQESTSGDEGRDVAVTEIWASPEEREIELRIRKGGQFELMDLVLRLLVCIKSMDNVDQLMAVSAELQQEQQQRTVLLRLKIKGEWLFFHRLERL
ncbi:putative transcription factor [Nymphaea thermarum]|nr:putative transcription factor [Nymphaea thermarum]